ncbi:MAG: DNA methyltransferase, partial [candidate division WOR-3 bacterium]
FIEPKTLEIKEGRTAHPIKIKARWSNSNDLRNYFSGQKSTTKFGKEVVEVYFKKAEKGRALKVIMKKLGFEKPNSVLKFTQIGSNDLLNLFSKKLKEYIEKIHPKPLELVRFSTDKSFKESIILDFFAGSGTTAHAVMKLNKEDGGKRKFILVEMADYFDTVIIPRVKKVAYSFNWKDGKPQDEDGIGVFFKYQILEQYEDALDNIELKENKEALELFKDEYLLKYFLDFETKESPYLLNIQMLKNPFAYKLKVNLSEVGEPQEMVVDIPETFNYLLGLKIKKMKARNHNNRKYLFILGEKDGKNVVVVWREYEDNWSEKDFMEDKKFIIDEIKSWNPEVVYINGQSVLTGQSWEVRYIEPEFKRLMEG